MCVQTLMLKQWNDITAHKHTCDYEQPIKLYTKVNVTVERTKSKTCSHVCLIMTNERDFHNKKICDIWALYMKAKVQEFLSHYKQ